MARFGNPASLTLIKMSLMEFILTKASLLASLHLLRKLVAQS